MNLIIFHDVYEHQKADAEIYEQADGDITVREPAAALVVAILLLLLPLLLLYVILKK